MPKVNMQATDNVSQAYASLTTMMRSYRELNALIENMPPSQEQAHFKAQRDQAKAAIDGRITPLWQRLAAHVSVSKQIEAGLREMPSEFFGAAAQLLGQSLTLAANESNQTFREIIMNISMLVPVQNSDSHPMSGLFDFFSTGPSPIIQHSDQEDIDEATKAVTYFYSRASQYPDNFPYTSVDDLIAALKAQNSYFMIGFGNAILSIIDGNVGYGESELQATMEKLADTGQGKIPSNWNTWFSSVGQAASNPSFWTSIEYTAGASAVQAVQGLQKVGADALTGLSAASSMLKYLPYIGLALAGFYVYTLAGGQGKALKGKFSEMKEKAKKAYGDYRARA